jgi:hypothetical protein
LAGMQNPISSTSSFKEFFLKILVPYLLLCVLIGVVFNLFFEKSIILGSGLSGAYKINRIITSNNKNEIAFFGSSRAERSYIPDSLVSDGFNYGMVGTRTDVELFCLSEECKKNKTTPIVFTFDLEGLNYGLGDISNYLYNSDYPPIRTLLGTDYKSIYKVPFLKYYGHFELYTKDYLNSKTNITKFNSKGGALEKNELTKAAFDELVKLRQSQKTTFHNDPKLLADFLSIIKANQNRKFIVVAPPYHSSFFTNFANIGEAKNFLNSLKAYTNVAVLNFSQLNYPDNYFFDTSHLNLTGAVHFNRVLKDSLARYIKS